MAKRLQLKREVNLYDLYADSGFAPGTQVQIQNQSDHQVYFAPASAPPADRHDYFILYPNERRVVEAASLTAWTKGYVSDILVGVPDAAVSSGPANTDELPEGATNLYFTEPRVLATVLTGFTPAAGVVTAADSVLEAFQKIAAVNGIVDTLNDLPAPSSVNAGTKYSVVNDSNTALNGVYLATGSALNTPASSWTMA